MSIIHWLILLIPILLLAIVLWLFVSRRTNQAERAPPPAGGARVTHGEAATTDDSRDEHRP